MQAFIDHIVSNVDLMPWHTALCYAGCLIALAVMQLSGHHDEMMGDGIVVVNVRRGIMCLLALSLLWAASYSATKGWQPWPPDILVILMIDVALAFRAGSIIVRWKRLEAINAAEQIRAVMPQLAARSHAIKR